MNYFRETHNNINFIDTESTIINILNTIYFGVHFLSWHSVEQSVWEQMNACVSLRWRSGRDTHSHSDNMREPCTAGLTPAQFNFNHFSYLTINLQINKQTPTNQIVLQVLNSFLACDVMLHGLQTNGEQK